jgi:hypothetical protein
MSKVMSKYRIVKRASALDPTTAVYDVDEKACWWWETCGTFGTLLQAEKRVVDLKQQQQYRVKREVIRLYD